VQSDPQGAGGNEVIELIFVSTLSFNGWLYASFYDTDKQFRRCIKIAEEPAVTMRVIERSKKTNIQYLRWNK
jgi:hypothetical protein